MNKLDDFISVLLEQVRASSFLLNKNQKRSKKVLTGSRYR